MKDIIYFNLFNDTVYYISLLIAVVVFLYDINMYVENNNIMQTFNCIKMIEQSKEFNEFMEEYKIKCFLLLRQLQNQKVIFISTCACML